jgi:hypothetical protein
MNLLPIKLLGAMAVAGLVAAGGSAFTATGLANTSNATQAVGIGSVNQTVSNASVSDVAYTLAPGSPATVTHVIVTFAAPLQTDATVTLQWADATVSLTDPGLDQTAPLSTTNKVLYDFTLTPATSTLSGIKVTVS